MKYCFGVDIGGTTVKLGLFSEAGAIVEKWEIVTRTENEGSTALRKNRFLESVSVCRLLLL